MATLCLLTLFAFVALGVGFGCGVWWYGDGALPFATANDPQADTQQAQPQLVEAERTAEWAVMAFQRIQDVASGLTGEAGTHASKVDAITAELQSIATGQSDVSSEAVLNAIRQIADAGAALKQRLAMAEKQLESQSSELHNFETEARTDSLTGLANRRAFDDEMHRQHELWKRQNTPFTLMIFDIDKFKNFNDSHGHQAGDEVLRSVGKLLTNTARQMDLPADTAAKSLPSSCRPPISAKPALPPSGFARRSKRPLSTSAASSSRSPPASASRRLATATTRPSSFAAPTKASTARRKPAAIVPIGTMASSAFPSTKTPPGSKSSRSRNAPRNRPIVRASANQKVVPRYLAAPYC